jgi:hypothetical protein
MGVFRRGRVTHPSTLVRWMLDGIRLTDGRQLKLEHIRVSNRLMTSRAALVRFLAAQQVPGSFPGAEPPRTPSDRRRANDRAEAELRHLRIR